MNSITEMRISKNSVDDEVQPEFLEQDYSMQFVINYSVNSNYEADSKNCKKLLLPRLKFWLHHVQLQ